MLIFTGTLFPFQMYLVPLLFGYQRHRASSTRGSACCWSMWRSAFRSRCWCCATRSPAISREVDEAARIEGASEWRVFISMIIPNAKGPLIALFLLQFTFIWNDLLFSSILANGIEVRSVMVALQSLQGTYSTLGPNVVITATLISSIPTVLLFIVLQEVLHGWTCSSGPNDRGTSTKRPGGRPLPADRAGEAAYSYRQEGGSIATPGLRPPDAEDPRHAAAAVPGAVGGAPRRRVRRQPHAGARGLRAAGAARPRRYPAAARHAWCRRSARS